jgi:two-component system chemotaxis response regulator CheY
MMPVMDGVAFSQALRKRPAGAEVPIVVISADGNPQRATAVGAVGYLAKPFDIDALLAQVAGITRDEPRAGA